MNSIARVFYCCFNPPPALPESNLSIGTRELALKHINVKLNATIELMNVESKSSSILTEIRGVVLEMHRSEVSINDLQVKFFLIINELKNKFPNVYIRLIKNLYFNFGQSLVLSGDAIVSCDEIKITLEELMNKSLKEASVYESLSREIEIESETLNKAEVFLCDHFQNENFEFFDFNQILENELKLQDNRIRHLNRISARQSRVYVGLDI